MQLRDWVEETAARLEERMGTAERRIDGCVAYTLAGALRRLGEMSGHQSSSIALLDAHRTRRRRLLDPPPRPGARVREAGARGRVRARALARGAARRSRPRWPARPPATPDARRRTWVPPGPTARRRCAPPRPAGIEEVPYPTIYDTVMAVQEGEADRAVVPIENALEGGVAVTLDTLALRGRPTCASSAEVVHPIHHCVVAARELELGRRRRAWSPTPRPPPSAARFLRERLRRRRARRRRLDRGRGAVGARLRRAGGGARLAPGGRALRLPGAGRGRRGPPRQRHPLRLAGARRRGGRARRRRRRRRSCSGAAATSRPAGSCDVLRELADRGVNLTRIESRPRRTSLGPLHVLRRPRGRRGRPAVAEALDGAARAGRGAAGSRLLHALRADGARLNWPASWQ